MLTKFLVFVLLFTPLASSAFSLIGGDEKGNGGVVIKCDTMTGANYEVLDLFEGRAAHGLTMDYEDQPNYLAMVDKIIDRIGSINPTRARLYRAYMIAWKGESRMIPGVDFTDLPDKGWGTLPKGCVLQQAVVQFKQSNINGFRYFVNQDIWNAMDEKNKAALVMHEFIYREGVREENGFENSIGVRYFNAVLHSTAIKKVNLTSYIDVLRFVGFQQADAHGYSILLHAGKHSVSGTSYAVSFQDDDHVRTAVLSPLNSIPVANKSMTQIGCTAEGLQSTINFNADGGVSEIRLNCPLRFALQSKHAYGSMMANQFIYDATGELRTARLTTTSRVEGAFYYENSDAFSILRGSDIKGKFVVGFYASGEVNYVCMGRNFLDYDRSWIVDGRGQKVSLNNDDSNGQLVLFSPLGDYAQPDTRDCNSW